MHPLQNRSTIVNLLRHKIVSATVFTHISMLPFIQRIKQPPRPDQLPPCFNDDKGDIIISMLYMICPSNIGTVQMRISSDKLIAVSPYFATTLRPEWVHNKGTGNEDCGDGTSRVMKRYELELDDDGKDVLVGKVATPLKLM